MRLTTIKYFELLCRIETNGSNSSKSPPNPQAIKFCFGLSTSRLGNDLNGGQEYLLYKHSGRIIHNKNTLADGPYYRFHSGDVIGCGIVYAPIGGSNGQIFFTKNGEVVYLGELGPSNINWFPFAMHDTSFDTKFNFGDEEPFVFNLLLFERSKIAQSLCPDFSYDRMQLDARQRLGESCALCYLCSAGKLWRLLEKREEVEQAGLTPATDGTRYSSALADIIEQEVHRSDSSADCYESDEESRKAPVSVSGPSFLINDRISLANHLFFSADSKDDTSAATERKPRVTLVNFANQEPISRALSTARSVTSLRSDSLRADSLPDGSRGMDGDDDPDWCENSMAVELSSVDSFAVQDMREIEISVDSKPSRSSYRSPEELTHQHQESNNLSLQPVKTGVESCDALDMSPNSDYGHSWWVEQRTAHSSTTHSSSNPNAMDCGGEGESEHSIATSLFVEVASLDEDGSYLGYGGACYDEEDFDPEHDQAAMEDAGRSIDSEESYATCYARWQSLQEKAFGHSEAAYSSLRHQQQLLNSEKLRNRDRSCDRRRHKRKREDSLSSSSKPVASSKRGVMCAGSTIQGKDGHEGSLPASYYVTRSSSPCSLMSAEKNDGEDGYDGASEKGGRYEEADCDGLDDVRIDNHDGGASHVSSAGNLGFPLPNAPSTVLSPPQSSASRKRDSLSTLSVQGHAPPRRHPRHLHRRRRTDRMVEDHGAEGLVSSTAIVPV
eukprot:scaffold2084_cov170-Ochromonas_danica.AAC.2